jgi:hypothetical protein
MPVEAEILTIDVDPIPEHLVCIVCQQLLCRSRMFDECGHTFCSFCMMQNDWSAMETTHTSTDYPVFKCPICREPSLKRWYDRPLNVLINQMAEELPQYQQTLRDRDVEIHNWIKDHIDEDDQFMLFRYEDRDNHMIPMVNLARMAARCRAEKARVVYESMMPVLIDAAANGVCRVSFSTHARELNCVMGTLSRMLFEHGVHCIHSTARETSVFLTEDQTQWASEWMNPTYDPELVLQAEREAFGLESDDVIDF